MPEKYIKASDCEKYFYEHLDDVHIAAAMNAIDEMPDADVVPVVRCKDCKWRPICCRTIRTGGNKPDDFCSFGERKGNDNG